MTPDVLDDARHRASATTLQLTVAGAAVPVRRSRAPCPYLPGQPSGGGVLVDQDLLGREAPAGRLGGTARGRVVAQRPRRPSRGGRRGARPTTAPRPSSGRRSARTRPTARCTSASRPPLWIVVAAALALAVSGLAMSAAVTVRSRRLEFARLQALGAPRSGLVGSVLVEHAILGAVGVLVGLALGGAPGPRGRAADHHLGVRCARPCPASQVQWDWADQLALLVRARGAGRGRRRRHHEHAAEARLRRAAAAGGRTMTTTTRGADRRARRDRRGVARHAASRARPTLGLLALSAMVLAVTVALSLAIPRVVAARGRRGRSAGRGRRRDVRGPGHAGSARRRGPASGRAGPSGRDPNIAATLRDDAASVHDAFPARCDR